MGANETQILPSLFSAALAALQAAVLPPLLLVEGKCLSPARPSLTNYYKQI